MAHTKMALAACIHIYISIGKYMRVHIKDVQAYMEFNVYSLPSLISTLTGVLNFVKPVCSCLCVLSVFPEMML